MMAGGAPAERAQETNTKPANKRSLARLAAVQALYQMDVSGTDLPHTLAEFRAHRLGREIDGDQYADADPLYFDSIVKGVVEAQRSLDTEINTVLTDGWPLKRLDLTLRAILRCGAFELHFRRDVPGAVVIDEYVEITHAFFDSDLTRLVNGVLNTILGQARPDG